MPEFEEIEKILNDKIVTLRENTKEDLERNLENYRKLRILYTDLATKYQSISSENIELRRKYILAKLETTNKSEIKEKIKKLRDILNKICDEESYDELFSPEEISDLGISVPKDVRIKIKKRKRKKK